MIRCPKCGHKNPDNAKGCGNCGVELPAKPSKSNSSNTKIIVVVAIIAIIAIVGVFASGMLSNTPSDNVNVDDKSDVVSPVVDNNTSDDDSSSTVYWASSKAEKFHLPTCEWAQKISESNKIVYHSRDEAIDDGKVPCTACNP